jgi:hypothetical protein
MWVGLALFGVMLAAILAVEGYLAVCLWRLRRPEGGARTQSSAPQVGAVYEVLADQPELP